MIGRPYRAAWSMVGRTLILDRFNHECVRPAIDIGPDWYQVRDEWERMVPVIVAALNGKPPP